MRKVLVLVLTLAVILSLSACDSSDYKKAIKLYEEGSYEQAIALFEELGQYEDAQTYLEEAQTALMLDKYGNVLELLAESSPWFYNGGSASLLNGISFSGAETTVNQFYFSSDSMTFVDKSEVSQPGMLEATIDCVFFDGNGIHHDSSNTYPFVIDDSEITVFLENGFKLSIPYSTNGGVLRLGSGEYLNYQDIENGLQGYWTIREESDYSHEYNVHIQNGKFAAEHANEGLILPKGRYYYDIKNSSYTLQFGMLKSSQYEIFGWHFNVIDGKPALLHFDKVLSPGTGLPGRDGYRF